MTTHLTFPLICINDVPITTNDSTKYHKFDYILNLDKRIHSLKQTTTYPRYITYMNSNLTQYKYCHITYQYTKTITTQHFIQLLIEDSV